MQDKFKLSDGTIISDGTIFCNKFNEFFTNLARKIPGQNVSHLHFMGPALVNSIFLTHVTTDEMVEITQ